MNPENSPWKITRPCTADWDQMAGDDRKRFCGQCGRHVHNVSAMTSAERAEFAKPANQHECIAYIYRANGTPMDLSIWTRLRRYVPFLRLVRWSALAALLPAVLTGCMGVPPGGRELVLPLPPRETQSPSAVPPGEKYETKAPDQ